MSKGKTSISGRIVAGIMAFLLSLFLTVALLLPVLYFTMLSPGAFTRTFKSVEYYQSLYDYAVDQASAILIPTGFPESVIEGAFTVDDIQTLVDGKVNGTLTQERSKTLLDGVEAQMLENMYTFMDANNIPRDIISAEELQNITQTVFDDVAENAAFPFIGRIRNYFALFLKLMVIGVIVCVGLSVLMCKLIHSLSIWRHVYFRNLAFATGGAAAMLLALPVGVLVWGGHNRVNIGLSYLFDFVQKLVGTTLWSFVACGILMLAVTVLLAVLSEKARRKVSGRKRARARSEAMGEGLPEV